MFLNKYPYTDFHELNLDYVLKQIAAFRAELDEISQKIYQKVMEEVQPQIDTIVNDFNTLAASFDNFKNEISNSQLEFEQQVNREISALEREFQEVQDRLAVMVEQVKVYSDVQNENLYNRIVDDINNGVIGLGNVKVINYITGETMTVQQMFDYLCIFHLSNPITYTQLALKAIDYDSLAALNLTYTDIIVNGNILIP